jgi:hypothetical protein
MTLIAQDRQEEEERTAHGPRPRSESRFARNVPVSRRFRTCADTCAVMV